MLTLAKHFYEKRVKVNRFPIPYGAFEGDECMDTNFPYDLSNQDIDADLLIIVTAEYNPKATFMAWAGSCL